MRATAAEKFRAEKRHICHRCPGTHELRFFFTPITMISGHFLVRDDPGSTIVYPGCLARRRFLGAQRSVLADHTTVCASASQLASDIAISSVTSVKWRHSIYASIHMCDGGLVIRGMQVSTVTHPGESVTAV